MGRGIFEFITGAVVGSGEGSHSLIDEIARLTDPRRTVKTGLESGQWVSRADQQKIDAILAANKSPPKQK